MRFRSIGLALIAGLAACAHGKIGNSNIDDTDENHEILGVVEGYQRAVESRDVDAVLAMVSPRYYEDNGNLDPSDDYDYRQLSDSLKADFERSKTIHLQLQVDDIQVDGDHAQAYLLYTVRGHADFPAGSKWKTNTDRARLSLERAGGKWLIVSGL